MTKEGGTRHANEVRKPSRDWFKVGARVCPTFILRWDKRLLQGNRHAKQRGQGKQ